MSKHVIVSETRTFAGVAPALSQVLVAVLAVLVVALQDNRIDGPETINAVIIGLGAIGVWFVPILDVRYGSLTKAAVSVLTAGLVVLASALTDGVSGAEWLQIVLAGFGAVGIAVGPTAPEVPVLQAEVGEWTSDLDGPQSL